MDKPALHGQSWDAGAAGLAVASDDLLIGIAANFILTAIVVLLNVLYQLGCRAFTRLRSMYITNSRPFPFEALPGELRDMVYTELLEDVYYPAPAAHQPASPLNGLLTNLWSHAPNPRTTPRKPSTWILLANKQIHAEFTSLLCKYSTFNLTVSPTNYQPLTSSNDNDNDNNNDPRIWNIAPSTFARIRTASLHLVATSAMLGCTDPRNMASSSWKLAERIRTQLSQMQACTSLELTVTAVGDPLWNPLWIWFHAAQALKYMGTAMAGRTAESSMVDIPTQTSQEDLTTSPPLLQLRISNTGPALHRITFRLDTWSPGENFLRREHGAKGGDWVWCCGEGHVVARDGGPEQAVREFCAMLYRECGTCRPEEEEEEEEEEEDEEQQQEFVEEE